MKRRPSVSATTSVLIAVLLSSCSDTSSHSDANVDALLQQAQQADSRNQSSEAEAKLKAAMQEAEEGKDVPLMKSINALSAFYIDHAQSEKCQALFRKSMGIGDSLIEKNSAVQDNYDFQIEYVKATVGLANFERDLGRSDTALRLYDTAKPISEKLGVYSPVKDTLASDRQTCFDAQRIQGDIERMAVVGRSNLSATAKREERTSFGRNYLQVLGGYDRKPAAETVKQIAALARDARIKWGLDDGHYAVCLSGLTDIGGRTGDFSEIDRLLFEDTQSLVSIENATKRGERIHPSEVVEVGVFVDTLVRRCQVSIAKLDWKAAQQQAELAANLARRYTPEDTERKEKCLRNLALVKQMNGEYKVASEIETEAIKILESRAGSQDFVNHHLCLATDQLLEGQIPQAVYTAEALSLQKGVNEAGYGAFQLSAHKILFEIERVLGDTKSAQEVQDKMNRLLTPRKKRLEHIWSKQLTEQESRLLYDQDKLAELISFTEKHLPDAKLYYRPWLRDCDLLCYAAVGSGETEKASLYLKKIESAKNDHFSDTLYLSRVAKVWMTAKSPDKKSFNLSVKKLLECVESQRHPTRLTAVDPLVHLADYLSATGQSEAAEKVYSCALTAYERVPGRVDRALLTALKGYHGFLVKQRRVDDAWQIKVRLEQKTKKLATVIEVTRDALKKSKLL